MIDRFEGAYRFLSNFYPAKVRLSPDMDREGYIYPTVEHAYQAAKARFPKDRMDIWHCASPGMAKRVGQQLALRPDWEEIKVNVMAYLLAQKFKGDPVLAASLASTGNEKLVEGNFWHDNFWGDCRCSRCRDIEGQNWLGRLLMAVREQLNTAEEL